MAKKREIEKNDWIEDVFESIRKGYEFFLNAAETMVKKFDVDPLNAGLFYRAATKAGISTGFLRKLEAVGRKTMDRRLLGGKVCKYPGQVIRLRVDLQKRVLDGEKFDYLTADNTPMKICLKECEKWQADQMYTNGRIRTLPEQRQWLEAKKSEQKSKNIKKTAPWYINKKKKIIYFDAASQMTFDEFKRVAITL